MNEHDRYQQGALPLSPPEMHVPDATTASDVPGVPPIDRDPDVLPHRRLPNDFWAEFHAVWAFRQRHGMVPVAPAEFAELRDWSDGVAWPVPDTEIGGASGPSQGYDDEFL